MKAREMKSGLAGVNWSRFYRPDFRFGAVNLIVLVLIMALGAMGQSGITPPEGAGWWVAPEIFAICASIVMGAALIVAPLWTEVIGLAVVYWLLLRLVYHDVALWPIHTSAYLALVLSTSFQVAKQWERSVILRLGRFRSLGGPGFFAILPLLDRVDRFVDHRVRATDFRAETTLTKDTVPVNVDAIAFWLVWDAKMSVLEVASFEDAVILSAQTALRARSPSDRPGVVLLPGLRSPSGALRGYWTPSTCRSRIVPCPWSSSPARGHALSAAAAPIRNCAPPMPAASHGSLSLRWGGSVVSE